MFPFKEQTGRRVRIVQTMQAAPHTQWNVHEVRFLRGGIEIPRSTAWKVRAWPNPWDVQLAFDNSPATRWRSWEIPKPGDYIEADFGRDQALDQVVVETSEDGVWSVQLRVEMMDSAGKWVKLATNIPRCERSARLRGSGALRLGKSVWRGVNYLLDSRR